ncbi:MAG: MATE family efflux transporter [Pseudomonadales bacterium]|nr:MATE family efflux transporter [Pseudomonadales bacterium]
MPPLNYLSLIAPRAVLLAGGKAFSSPSLEKAAMRDLTQGPVMSTLISLAVPTAFGMLFQTLYLLVDLYFVAGLGEAAMAGVGAASTVMFMVMALTQVLGVSTVALMAQAVGRKEQGEANRVFNQSLLIAVFMAALTLLLGHGLADVYMRGIAADAASSAQGARFLHAFIPGMALQFALIGMASALRATGIVKPGMVVQILTVLLNTALAPVLIVGWGPVPALGVVGAGLASTLSVCAGLLMLLFYFIKLEKYVRFDFSRWKPDYAVWKQMLVIGLPAGGEMLLMFLYFGLVYVLIQKFGAAAQAGFSVGGRIMQAVMLPTMAIAFSIGPMVGQNVGAQRGDRVREICRKGLWFSAGVMLVVTLFLQINPTLLVAGFTQDAQVLEVGGDFLQLVSLNFVAQGIVFGCSGMFQGLGNTRPALLSSACRLGVFVMVAFVVASRENFAVHDVWYVSVLSVWCQAFFSLYLIRRELNHKLGRTRQAQTLAV